MAGRTNFTSSGFELESLAAKYNSVKSEDSDIFLKSLTIAGACTSLILQAHPASRPKKCASQTAKSGVYSQVYTVVNVEHVWKR